VRHITADDVNKETKGIINTNKLKATMVTRSLLEERYERCNTQGDTDGGPRDVFFAYTKEQRISDERIQHVPRYLTGGHYGDINTNITRPE
jgi:hypothetical protein